MQTLFHYMVTRRRQLVNVCLVSVLLLLSPENASPEYSRSCRCIWRNMGWSYCVWNTYSEERFKKTFRISHETFHFILIVW